MTNTNTNTYHQSELANLLNSLLDAEEIYDLGTQLRQNSASDIKYEQALCCFHRAADMGHSGAQNDLGTMFREGFGCKSDISAAIHWYERAADQGEPMAYYNLATIYLHGVDTPQDHIRAAEYMSQAAHRDCILACADFGTMYRFGNGVNQDFLQAAEWHFRAALHDDINAKGNLCDYYKELIHPALNGNITAAQVLQFIYGNGYCEDANPAIGWAWTRWAYDVCLPSTPHEVFDPLHGQLDCAFRKAKASLPTEIRDHGDEYLFQLVHEHNSPLNPSWQPILIVGGELGFVRLIGRWWSNGWEIRRETFDGSMELLDDIEGEMFANRSEVRVGWNNAAELIEKYPLHHLHPIFVHPEFGEEVFQIVMDKSAMNENAITSEELWRKLCVPGVSDVEFVAESDVASDKNATDLGIILPGIQATPPSLI